MSFIYNPSSEDEAPTCAPAGRYDAIIVDVEDKENKAGTGKFLRIKLQIVADRYRNFEVTDLINYEHQNPQAQSIARKQLRKLAIAAFGEDKQFGTPELIGKICTITTKVEEYNGDYTAKVASYVTSSTTQPSTPVTPQDVLNKLPQPKQPIKAFAPQAASEDDDDVAF
jgi:hypothetical protein